MTGVGSPCLRCGAAAADRHHPTGRSQRAYLDPELTVPLCRRCHAGEHAVLEALGLDAGRWNPLRLAELNGIERVELRLRRVAVTFARLSKAPGGGVPDLWALLAGAFRRWADELAAELARLDEEHAGWRNAPPSSHSHASRRNRNHAD